MFVNINCIYFLFYYIILGRKSGKGYFEYKAGTKSRPENTEAISLLEKFKLQPKGEQSVENQQLRMVSRFVNEAVLCLEESILNSPVCMP
jgi:enoyl-CoA hydratase/long-chain 3-hydroxyacyl-CoA dehydrogenase